jgi:hypothetical protein
MPYVQGFTNDVFISFAHIDNTGGWVNDFESHLAARLAQLDVKVTIWRDSKLSGTDIFSDEIFTNLKSSAILISIVSPNGIKSRWCQEERQKFEQFAAGNGGFRVGNALRAVKVVKTPLDNDEHRSLFNTLGFEFYRRNKQQEKFQEFDIGSAEYRAQLDSLSQDIKRLLDSLRNLGRTTVPQLAVYVADASSDLDEQRQAIVRQIDAWGYSVFPDNSLHDSPNVRSEVESALAKCILSVHLVSSKRGMIPEGEEKSIVALQYESAQTRAMDRVLWIAKGSQPEPGMLSLIQSGSQHGVEILEDRTIEDLKEVIEAKLKRLRTEASVKKEANTLNVYMVCDRKDHPFIDEALGRERAKLLVEYFGSKGFTVWLPPQSAMEETQRRRDHRATLKMSDAVLLYWGSADEKWFRDNLRELIMARTRRSRRRQLTEAIYFGGPPLDVKSQYRNLLEFVFEQFEDFRPEDLNPLFQRLQRHEV